MGNIGEVWVVVVYVGLMQAPGLFSKFVGEGLAE